MGRSRGGKRLPQRSMYPTWRLLSRGEVGVGFGLFFLEMSQEGMHTGSSKKGTALRGNSSRYFQGQDEGMHLHP